MLDYLREHENDVTHSNIKNAFHCAFHMLAEDFQNHFFHIWWSSSYSWGSMRIVVPENGNHIHALTT